MPEGDKGSGAGPRLGKTGLNANSGKRFYQAGSSGKAGVIVHATVEPFGPVGDTELNISVKWPASQFNGAVISSGSDDSPLGGPANVE